MRSRTPISIRLVRYSLLVLSLLFAGGIVFIAVGDMSEVEADPLSGYKTTETAR